MLLTSGGMHLRWRVLPMVRASIGASVVFSEDLIVLGASALKERENPYLRSPRYKG